jgi:GAF domain-containing protein
MAIYERRGEHLALEYLDGDAYRMFASVAIPLGMGLSGWVAENGKAIINGNPSVEPGYLADPKKFSVLRSALSVPIHGPDGVRGVASLYRQERDSFSPEQLSLLQTIADKLGRLTSAVEAAPYQAF